MEVTARRRVEFPAAPAGSVAVVLAAAAAALGSGTALDSGLTQMRQGNLAEARQHVARASQAAPASPAVRLAQAALARQEDEAVRLLTGLAGDTTAPDSFRAAAYDRLGSLAMLKRNYVEASRQTARTCSLSDAAPQRLRRFQAALAAGEYRMAAEAAAAVAGADSAAALYCRGLLSEQQRNPSEAYAAYKSAVRRLPATSPYYLPSLAGCALSADRLGYVSLAAQHRADLERADRNCLEHSLFAQGFVPLAASMPQPPPQPQPAVATDKRATPVAGERYTIQVGSFAAPANAQRLAQRLKAEFGEVRVEQARVGEATHYRVRVGSFDDRDSAERFGKERISTLGVSYKVLREQ